MKTELLFPRRCQIISDGWHSSPLTIASYPLSNLFRRNEFGGHDPRQLERALVKRNGVRGQNQQPVLLAPAVTQDKGSDRFKQVGVADVALHQRRQQRCGKQSNWGEPVPTSRWRPLGACRIGRWRDRVQLSQKIVSRPEPLCNSRAADMHEAS